MHVYSMKRECNVMRFCMFIQRVLAKKCVNFDFFSVSLIEKFVTFVCRIWLFFTVTGRYNVLIIKFKRAPMAKN